jgi:hypothetical protein
MLSLRLSCLLFALTSHINAFEPVCPIIFDGRVPPMADLGSFDRAQTPFSGLRGRNVKWSSILSFPQQVSPSVFDYDFGGKPLAIQIDESSVLRPSGKAAENGYRRATLIFTGNNGSDASTSGVVTYHWSVRQTRDRPLNLTHEYVSVFHERANGQGDHFQVSAGLLVGKEKKYLPRNWKVLDRNQHVLWQTPILFDEWENFAITLDYTKQFVPSVLPTHSKSDMNRQIQVYYSTGQNHLQAVTKPEANENDRGGLFQVGLLKKSTGAKNPSKDGYHSPKFNDALIYGSIFVENSADDCVSR